MKPDMENLSRQEQFELAKKKTAEITARGRKTKKELCDKLMHLGFAEEVCDAVAEWAQEYYFINDSEYARAYIQDAARKYGKRRIVQALRFKGVDADVIEDALSEFDFEDTLDKLYADVEKKLGGNFERKNMDKVVRHFLTRGFAYDDVKNAIDIAKQNQASKEDDFEF